jgi:hypothetical protein
MRPSLVVVPDVGAKERSRCRRPMMSVQSRHSARTVPTHRSQNALAFGARIGVRTILMPSERNTSSKASVNLVSRSWIRNLGDRPFSWRVMARFRACWVTQAESGCEVTPPRWTVLVPSSIHTSTYRVFNRIVSTVRKSHARIPAACCRRNALHVGPRLGAGPRPARRSTVATVVAETFTPSLNSSPRIPM